MVPDIEVGGYSSRLSLSEAQLKIGREPICQGPKHGTISVREECGFPIVDQDGSYTLLIFAADGAMLEMQRFISLPEAMELSEALAQARQRFEKLGTPGDLAPGPTLDRSKCNLFGKSEPNCARLIPPISNTPFGIVWRRGDGYSDVWRLTVKIVREKPTLPDFPEELAKQRLITIDWENVNAREKNHKSVSDKVNDLLEASKRTQLKF
ncbi:MAG: hypothetical protein AB7S74_01930 [Hyphomicrobium sp.]